VDNGDNLKMREVQWCEHLEVEADRCRGYAVVQILNMSADLVVGHGLVRATCKECTPRLLAHLFNAAIRVT